MLQPLLLRFFRDGDAAAMETLVRRTRPRLLAVARRIGAPQDAEDSVQAAYHALLRHGAFRGPIEVEAWLTTTVVRIAYRRKAVTRRDATLADRLARDPVRTDPSALAVRGERIALVRREIAKLPAKYRDVLVLRHLEGLSVDETARLLDLAPATVKTRTRRGLALLRVGMAPWAARALLVGPWLFADLWRGGALGGALMGAKTTATIAGVALAAAAAGFGAGVSTRSETARSGTDARRAPPAAHLPDDGPAASPAGGAAVASEREETSWKERALAAEAELARLREASAAPAAAEAAFERRYAEACRALGVGEDAMRKVEVAKSVLDDFYAQRGGAKTQQALNEIFKEIEALGGEAFRAAVAHLRATESPESEYGAILGRTWKPGEEAHLLALARDAGASVETRRLALRGLGATDTEEVRGYLIAQLDEAPDPMLVGAAAQAVGWLKEERAIPALERVLARPEGDPAITEALNGLGTMRGDAAKRAILRYIDKEHASSYYAWAVRVLTFSDGAGAAEAARRVLEGPHAAKLTANDRNYLASLAK